MVCIHLKYSLESSTNTYIYKVLQWNLFITVILGPKTHKNQKSVAVIEEFATVKACSEAVEREATYL